MAETLKSEIDKAAAEQEAELLMTLKNGGFATSPIYVSHSNVDFSPLSALGLQRVGEEMPSPTRDTLQLNRRGLPARIRKRNKIYFDENLISSPTQTRSPKKITKTITKKLPLPATPPQQHIPVTPVKLDPLIFSTRDKAVAQQNGVRLRNFLKLPQAHKWVYFEWFYSNIDKPLFEGDNDFEIVLKEAFPNLASRKLIRVQWGLIRKMMGKPRRCSQAFFNEERQALIKKRQILRLLQQRKITDISVLKDIPLPSQIPMQLVVGTRVTARLWKPENGLFPGRIDAVDTSDNTYRISFDRHGTHSIPDYEVLSNEVPDMMPLSSFSQKFRPRLTPIGLVTPPRPILPKMDSDDGSNSPAYSLNNDPLLAPSPIKMSKLLLDDSVGGFTVKNLTHIVQLSKILKAKRDKISSLREMNSQVEKRRSYSEEITLDFKKKYASLVLDIEKINRELNRILVAVQSFCQEIAPDNQGMSGPVLLPYQIKERCYEEAAAIVDTTNHSSDPPQSSSESILDLIAKFTSIMLQIKNLSETEVSAFELTSLQETLEEVRNSLHTSNQNQFKNNIEVHISHIMSAISQMGTLQAFNEHKNNAL